MFDVHCVYCCSFPFAFQNAFILYAIQEWVWVVFWHWFVSASRKLMNEAQTISSSVLSSLWWWICFECIVILIQGEGLSANAGGGWCSVPKSTAWRWLHKYRTEGIYVGKNRTNTFVVMYLASWYLKYNKVYRCVMLKPVALLRLGGDWKGEVSFLLYPHLLHGGGRSRISLPSDLAVGRLIGPRTILYMTVKVKILAVVPQNDNLFKSLSP